MYTSQVGDAVDDALLRKLAIRLDLDRALTFLDLETTGPLPEIDRIVEIAAVTLHPGGRVVRFHTLVNPEMPILATATGIHGLKDKDVRDAPTFRALARKLFRALHGRDLAGYNLRHFDLRMLAAEFRRVGIAYDPDRARVVDVMRIFHLKEPRDLDAAVKFYLGQTHRGHRAPADVEATISVFRAQLDRYSLPSKVAKLAAYCRNQPPDWLTRDGRIVWRGGTACLTFGRHAGKPLQTLAREEHEYLLWILENDFAPEVKRLVSEALEGKFPGAPRGLADNTGV